MNNNGKLLVEGNLTKGLLYLSVPMLISGVLQNLQSVIDMFWVGKLGADAVAAVSIGGTVLMLIGPLILGMATGTVALVSRMMGAGQYQEASDVAAQSVTVSSIVGILTGVFGVLYAEFLCHILGATDVVNKLAVDYLVISFAGIFTVFILFSVNSSLQGAGNTIVPMISMILSNLLNLVLNPIFIFGWFGMPAMGVKGSALATVISQFISAVVVVYFMTRGVAGLKVRLSEFHKLSYSIVVRILKIGLPGSGQMLSRSLMALVLMAIVTKFGTESLAAYGIVMRLNMIMIMPAFAIGNSAATIVGQNLGASKVDRSEKAGWVATWLNFVLMFVTSIIVYVWAPDIMKMFTDHEGVITAGSIFIRLLAPFNAIISFPIVLGRALVGAGDTMAPMFITIFSLWILQVPFAFYLPHLFSVPLAGVAWASNIATVFHALLIIMWYVRGSWKSKQI